MKNPIQVLYVEDNSTDRQLVRGVLDREQGIFHVSEVNSRKEYEKRLSEHYYDVVLSDLNILGYKGLNIIDSVAGSGSNCPLIIVTNSGSEEIAVEVMKRGAADYIIKNTEHIWRLPHSIYEAVGKTELLKEKRMIQKALLESEAINRSILGAIPDLIFIYTIDGTYIDYRVTNSDDLFFAPEQFLGKNIHELFPEELCGPYLEKLQETVKSQKTQLFEYELLLSGKKRYFMSRLFPFLNNRVMTVNTDITDRKQREEQLQKQQYYLQRVQELVRFGTWEINLSNNTLKWTDELYDIYEIPSGTELHYDTFLNFVHPEDRSFVDDEWHKAITQKKTYNLEHRILINENVKWVKEIGELQVNEQGDCNSAIGVTQDITDRKMIEEKLLQERNRAQKYLDIAGVMFVSLNAEGEVILANRKVSDICGYSQEQIIGQNWFDTFLPGHIKNKVKTVFKNLMAGEVELFEYNENPILTKNGEERIIAWHNTILKNDNNEIIGTLSSGEDITARRRVEDALIESERFLTQTGHMAKIGGWEHDLLTGEATWTDALYEIVEIESGPPPGVSAHLDYYPPAHRSILESAYNEAIDKGTPFDLELQVYTAKGNMRWCRAYGEPVYEGEACVRLRGTFQDITDQKLAEEEIQTLSKFPIENPNPVFRCDKDGNLLFHNEASGLLLEKWSKQNTNRITGDLLTATRSALKTNTTIRQEFSLNNIVYTMVFSPNNEMGFVTAYGLDITTQKQNQAELQSSRDQLRRLSHHLQNAREEQNAYIAREIHDEFGQSLTGCVMLCTLLEDELEKNGIDNRSVKSLVNEMQTELNESINKIRNLSAQLRPSILDSSTLSEALHWLISQFEVNDKLEFSLNEQQEINTLGSKKNLAVFRILQESLTNIVRHASATRVTIDISQKKNKFHLCVKDNGRGFSPIGNKGGLSFGLMNMKERALFCGGKLSVNSKVDKGTTVILEIPVEGEQ